MAKGYIRPTFGFHPIDNEPFLDEVTFPSEASALEHAKTGVAAYVGKQISVTTPPGSYIITAVGPNGAIEKLGFDSSTSGNINELKAYIDASLNTLNNKVTSNKSETDASIKDVSTRISNLTNTVISNKTNIDSSIGDVSTRLKNLADTVSTNKTNTDASLNTLSNIINSNKANIDSSITNINSSLKNLSGHLNWVII